MTTLGSRCNRDLVETRSEFSHGWVIRFSSGDNFSGNVLEFCHFKELRVLDNRSLLFGSGGCSGNEALVVMLLLCLFLHRELDLNLTLHKKIGCILFQQPVALALSFHSAGATLSGIGPSSTMRQASKVCESRD